jgi:hypothetical protein
VPSSDTLPGSSRESITSRCCRSYGFCGATHGAKIAASKISNSRTNPAVAMRLLKKRCKKRVNGVSACLIWFNICINGCTISL